ncbi:MAG: hypothetical protein RhofKO_27580 [Rhodothermales bacterium]
MPDRVFSEQEIAQILQRAIEKQEADAEKQRARHHGLNLAELERLGSEVGIAPEYLQAAALEVHRTGVQGESQLTGTHYVVERLIPGSLTDAAWGEIVTALRDQVGIAGEDRVSIIGNMHEWNGSNAWGIPTKATLSQRGDRVALRLSQRVGMLNPIFDSLFYGLGFATLPAILYGEAQGFSFIQGMLLFATIGVLLSALSYTLLTNWRKKKHRQLETIADRLEPLVAAQSAAAEMATPLATNAPDARLSLPAEEAHATTSTSMANRTRA